LFRLFRLPFSSSPLPLAKQSSLKLLGKPSLRVCCWRGSRKRSRKFGRGCGSRSKKYQYSREDPRINCSFSPYSRLVCILSPPSTASAFCRF
jgi:hypothetical protein